MPFPVSGDYLRVCGIIALQMRSVQSGLTDWKWPVVIGWAACVAPAQVGGQASVH